MGSQIELDGDQLAQLGQLISQKPDNSYCGHVIAFLATLVPHDSSLVLVYHRARRPDLVFDGLNNPQRRNSATSYVEASYLLDPFYQQALKQRHARLLRFRDICGDDASLETYFETYYRHSAVVDEVNFVVPLAPDRAAALSIERAADHQPFSEIEISRLEQLVPLVAGLVLRLFSERPAAHNPADQSHARLEHRLAQFRNDVLTLREREVAGMLLKGQSVAQIATSLAISVETARVHRRNIYAKLSISSLAELFALAFDWVTENAR